ncbi:hypothetical protein ACFSKN_05585 [Mariniflexile gromovii]|uniref:Uncharacterized protein n=1 Tax=Mariniflexile gromovii TaxID=362523 RepID=A0ABS4BTJ7_9FLAO|nr:hypothetical protein [Mariniflexile gromovii]MBP0903918.1 hypothetical protein [Mariniflexile gromovii]
MKVACFLICLSFCFVSFGQRNLFFHPDDETVQDTVRTRSGNMPITFEDYDPNETISFDKKITFSFSSNSGTSTTSEFLVNTNKGYMAMNKEMMERMIGMEFPHNNDVKVHYRVTNTKGKTFYYMELNGVKQVINRSPISEVSIDETNMSVAKFNRNYSPTGNNLNISSQNYNSVEYQSNNSSPENEYYVYVADQNSVNINPNSNPKTAGIFGLGYIFNNNKTQLVTRVENEKGTAEIENIEDVSIGIDGNSYRRRENIVADDHERVTNVKEDYLTKKQEYINRSSNAQRTISNKEQEILNVELEMEAKRKSAMNKYIEDGAPAEQNAQYALESYDPKDAIEVKKIGV